MGTAFVIIILTYGQIEDMPAESYEFAFCLLILVHSSSLS